MSGANTFLRALRRAMEPWAVEHGFAVATRAGEAQCLPKHAALFVREPIPGFVEQVSLSARRSARVNPTKAHDVFPMVAMRVRAVEDTLDRYLADTLTGYLEGTASFHPMDQTTGRTMETLLPEARKRRMSHTDDAVDLGDRIARELEHAGLPWLESHRDYTAVLDALRDTAYVSINNVQRQLILASLLGERDTHYDRLRPHIARLGPMAKTIVPLVEHLESVEMKRPGPA